MSEQQFERGTSLSIFVSDRREDIGALIFAIIVNNYTCQKKVIRKKLEQVMLRMTEV